MVGGEGWWGEGGGSVANAPFPIRCHDPTAPPFGENFGLQTLPHVDKQMAPEARLGTQPISLVAFQMPNKKKELLNQLEPKKTFRRQFG